MANIGSANSNDKFMSLENVVPLDVAPISGEVMLEVNSKEDEVLGKTFTNINDGYDFYNQYAFKHGFGIRILHPFKDRITSEVYKMVYVCNKHGFKNLKDKKSSSGIHVKRRRETRTGCGAMFRISKREDGLWFVDIFDDTHNHPMIESPSKILKHRSHAKYRKSNVCKSLVSSLSDSGLRPSQITKAVNTLSGPGVCNITQKNVINMLSGHRQNNVGRECMGIVKYFQRKAATDSSFYFAMDLDDTGSLKNVFWADGRSRSSYITFGDVIVFDVTYKTNKYHMPFAPFIGVNHHRQSILFGASLLEDETEDTFSWLFKNFLQCMFNRQPIAIITDQDNAMCKAIVKVFPNARHRFCAWHIMKHFNEHLQPYRIRHVDFQIDFSEWIKSQTKEEFEVSWNALAHKYDIEDDSWLARTYALRKYWAKCYLNDVFFAGMTTSGRSESINAFFDGYVNSSTMLNDFVVQYDKELTSRRDSEEEEDFNSMNSKAILSSQHPIEVKAGERYTRRMFELFRKEWLGTLDCGHHTMTKGTEVIEYKVGVLIADKSKWRTVKYFAHGEFQFICSCGKFETFGILCKHLLYILKKKNVKELPDEYILSRWTLDSRFTLDKTNLLANDANVMTSMSFASIQANVLKVMDDARHEPSELRKIFEFLSIMLEEQSQRMKLKDHPSSTHVNVRIPPEIVIRDPIAPTKTKGRPKGASRLQSRLELSMNEKKKRTCSYCHLKGHYLTSCPKKKVDDGETSTKNMDLE